MKKKILILFTSVGLGHKFIAENIAYHLEQSGYEVLLHDILQVQEGLMVDFGVWLHGFINRRLPFIWRWLYFSKVVNSIAIPLRIPLAKSNSENLEKIVLDFNPDCIISTQTTASAAVASLIWQNKFSGKFVIAFSDYHLHEFWLYDEADMYLVNIDEQKDQMIKLGIHEEKIFVCGITLKPVSEIDEAQLRNKLDIPSANKVVIFGSGSLGIGFSFSLLSSYLKKLTNDNPNVSAIVLCGKNESLQKQLDELKLVNVTSLGFYKNPLELYAMADVLVTKPGGLTIAEALQAGIKIQITHTLPGQEEPNYEYLLNKKLVNKIPKPLNAQTLTDATIRLLNSPSVGETPESAKLTQSGQEGRTLRESINSLFHTD